MGVWYYVKVRTKSPIAGGVPTTLQALTGRNITEVKRKSGWSIVMAVTKAKTKEQAIRILTEWDWNEVKKAAEKYPDDIKSQGLTVFRRDENGIPFVKAHMIKSMIKETMAALGYQKKRVDQVHHGVWVYPIDRIEGDKIVYRNDQIIHIYEDENMTKVVKDADGIYETYLTTVTPKGPRTTYKYSEVILPPKYLHFLIYVSEGEKGKPVLAEDELKHILIESGMTNGIGSGRPMGFGRYDLIEFKRVINVSSS